MSTIFEEAIHSVLKKIDMKLDKYTNQFPDDHTANNVYQPRKVYREDLKAGANVGWTTGFWTGMLWLAYEVTGDEKYRKVAEIHVDSFGERMEKKIGIDTHDLGFLYTLSCVSAYKITGNEKAKGIALKAADHLMTRFFEKAGIIQAWGDLNDPNQRGRIIIDCLMNLPLLYWASEVTGDDKYKDAAHRHALKSLDHIVRENATTHHTYYFDTETGNPRFGKTHQGYSDESCWARGQAWGVYGFPLSFNYTNDEKILNGSLKVTNYFLGQCPEDLVAYWDLCFSDGSGEVRDSSASSIAVCGLFELAKSVQNDETKTYYENAAFKILQSLYENYSSRNEEQADGLLLQGVYNRNTDSGVNEANLWGDYFYFEALVRATRDWKLYW
ncbi:glycoside hydrolase family 88 protein [Paenibacillus alkaliterrae]|uniref:glycoside hydrolase family 88 protein n=1 Tax=Paenibacillus alkaliterrae TaxID=320909 RepID=UPI001F1CC8B6|nr:glycoside hydrolase family 88 protein [Paenibacillus alkaliterrae]MCF2938651.1 glycoside hydrolase family 88 protein [Paenibacillus alkaliterrae]